MLALDAPLPPAAVPTRRRRTRTRRTLRFLRRTAYRLQWAGRLVVSAVVLVGVLSVLAAVPGVNVYVLGYLLEAEGRVGRGGRWRDVLPWVRFAPRIAAIAVGSAGVLIPTLLLADFARDAALVEPGGRAAAVLRTATTAVAVLTVAHLFFAYVRGGGLWTYVRPIKNVRSALAAVRQGRFAADVADRLGAAVAALRPVGLTWLGARGLAAAAVWLFVPCLMMAAAGPANGPRLLLKFAGIAAMASVFPMLLVLQARLAVADRFAAAFAPRAAARCFGRAPLAWLVAGFVTATLALPLCLFKIVAPPRDAMWLLTPSFVAAMLPARIVTGWAYRRAARRTQRRHLLVTLTAAAGLFAVGLVYAGGVFLSQFVNEHGRRAVFEQHAFSLPVPF